ncbi:MAG: sigma-70 family RNA polymerase sigma factor [Candidatus Pedobacter colombiensis]|uniref:Sigma-70 family RNA polymerase sigma factor n=1 Tax=Candidatus Pedobacter colombiensis TaxID=3121371 RepID=A0AAJ5WC58_9SPHI|nr:sigma-70 family RNA polymerase sigma factor [Pedobacter sp.]WEK20007.1 MAG: sigma-70 family RNA polymerase sigma factor [Pedobacter sp.]
MLIEEDDSYYWEQMRLGDKQALFELYNNMYFHLIRFGLKISADDELVKDCVNQIFLNLWDKRARLTPVDHVKSYLMTALKRCILDQLAYVDKMNTAMNKMGAEEEWAELSYEEIMIRLQQDDELKGKLRLAIKQLTPRQMELIQLKFFEGLTYEQIAERTSQTVKTAYNTIYDAIKTLKRLLK